MGRVLKVTIGQSASGGMQFAEPTMIEATIKLDRGSKPNKATVKVYNLAPGEISWCEQSNSVIQVLAGDPIASSIFLGDVLRQQVITESLPGGGVVTTIEAQDGHRRFTTALLHRSYPPGTSRDVALTDALAALGLPIGYRSPNLAPLTFASGYTTPGPVAFALDELMVMDASHWTIQRGAVYLFAPFDTQLPGTSPILSADTGLIGSPKRKDKGGVSCVCRLQPAFSRCGMGFTLKSRWINGIFKAATIEHHAKSDWSQWETKIEGVPVAE